MRKPEDRTKELVILELQKKKASTERERLYSLFMQSPAVINVMRGPEHVFELCNPMARALVGGRDLAGLKVRDAVPEYEGQGYFELLDQVYRTGIPHAGRGTPSKLRQPDGTSVDRFFNYIFQPWIGLDGKVEGILNFAVDVTDEILAKKKNELLLEELKKALQARDEFMSIASHELKTPMTALKLQIQLRQEQMARNGPSFFTEEKVQKNLEADVKQVNQLARLVGDMLEASRMSCGTFTLHPETFDLVPLARGVIDQFHSQMREINSVLSFKTEGSSIGKWDRDRIEKVFTNLLINAMKFGGGYPIEVSIKNVGAKVQLSVRDHGVGVSKENQHRIFEQFERTVSASYVNGLGLGLFIARRIAEAHGGSIHLKSELNRGSVFTVELPLSA